MKFEGPGFFFFFLLCMIAMNLKKIGEEYRWNNMVRIYSPLSSKIQENVSKSFTVRLTHNPRLIDISTISSDIVGWSWHCKC